MVNHHYDDDADATRCGEHKGVMAWHVSANGAVSCPDCYALLSTDERQGQWYEG